MLRTGLMLEINRECIFGDISLPDLRWIFSEFGGRIPRAAYSHFYVLAALQIRRYCSICYVPWKIWQLE